MSEIISKELLSEVLGEEVYLPIWAHYNDLVYSKKSYKETGNRINIYELAHKCKEWAVKAHMEDKNINSGNHFYVNHFGSTHIGLFDDYQVDIGYRGLDKDSDWADLSKYFKKDTEPEAIFKACEWILDKKDKS